MKKYFALIAFVFCLYASPALASTITVPTGSDPVTNGQEFQAALNQAQLGDVITLTAGAEYDGNFTLPAKSGCTANSNQITIRTSAYASLPAANIRISPSQSALLAKIVSVPYGTPRAVQNNEAYPINILDGGCYRLLGLEITNNVGNGITNVMVNALTETTNLTFEKLYIHPKECPNTAAPYNTSGRFAMNLFGTNITVLDSYLDCFWGIPMGAGPGTTGVDTRCFNITITLGPQLYRNNYCSAWYTSFFTGGSNLPTTQFATLSGTPTLTQATLSNVSGLSPGMFISFIIPRTSNYSCQSDTSSCWGIGQVTAINGNTVTFTELKTYGSGSSGQSVTSVSTPPAVPGQANWGGTGASYITFEHNYFHIDTAFATWLRSTNGNHPKGYFEIKVSDHLTLDSNVWDGFPATFGFNKVNQYGQSPWIATNNTVIKNNWVKAFNVALMAGFGEEYLPGYCSDNNQLTNNLFEGPDNTGLSGAGTVAIFSLSCSTNTLFSHNTILTGYPANYSQYVGIQIGQSSTYTIKDNVLGYGNYGVPCYEGSGYCRPTYTETKNLLALNVGSPNSSPYSDFPNSLVVPNWSAVKFVDPANSNWALQASSPGHLAASDGTDIGVNWAALIATTAGVTNGTPGISTPPPPPTDTTAPSIPTSLSATAVSSTAVNLSWSPSSDNVAVVGYKIYRGGVQIGTSVTTSFSDTGLSPSTLYSYTVSAYDAAGNNSTQSISASATTQTGTPPTDTTSPSTPTSLSATAVSSSAINLTWSPSTDNVGVTGYKIYRSGVQVGTAFTTSFSDTGLAASTLYTYTVSAYDAAGNTSSQSLSASATTQTVVTPPPSPTFSIGAKVLTNANLNVRNKANTSSGKILCTQPTGSKGTITAGPTSQQGYTWWNINFDTGCDGFAVQTYLTLATVADATAPVLLTRTLTVGATGTEVTALQNVLSKIGYFNATVTGYFGTITEQAVMKFQSANALDAVGVVGPKTRAKLLEVR